MLDIRRELFLTIPDSFAGELAEEVELLYKEQANRQISTIPILEEIVGQLTYYMLRFAMYESTGEDVILESNKELSIESLFAALSEHVFETVYGAFKQNIEYYLQQRAYFYQSHWLFGAIQDAYYEEIVNSPLQEVW